MNLATLSWPFLGSNLNLKYDLIDFEVWLSVGKENRYNLGSEIFTKGRLFWDQAVLCAWETKVGVVIIHEAEVETEVIHDFLGLASLILRRDWNTWHYMHMQRLFSHDP